MKLFLSSMAISYSQAPAFVELVGKKPTEIKLGLIENAADGEPGEKPWLYSNRAAINSHGFKVTPVDLNDYRTSSRGLLNLLKEQDVIWVGGGNVYYLRWILHQTKADALIKELVKGGKVYGGGSAGAVVAGPTIKGFEAADDPKYAPEIIDEGLSLTDIVMVPHWADGEDDDIMRTIKDGIERTGYKTVAITNDQALVIDGPSAKIVP